jgi:hypothetical protein
MISPIILLVPAALLALSSTVTNALPLVNRHPVAAAFEDYEAGPFNHFNR